MLTEVRNVNGAVYSPNLRSENHNDQDYVNSAILHILAHSVWKHGLKLQRFDASLRERYPDSKGYSKIWLKHGNCLQRLNAYLRQSKETGSIMQHAISYAIIYDVLWLVENTLRLKARIQTEKIWRFLQTKASWLAESGTCCDSQSAPQEKDCDALYSTEQDRCKWMRSESLLYSSILSPLTGRVRHRHLVFLWLAACAADAILGTTFFNQTAPEAFGRCLWHAWSLSIGCVDCTVMVVQFFGGRLFRLNLCWAVGSHLFVKT